jgi:O-antigen/teichoic acid export membrane protein
MDGEPTRGRTFSTSISAQPSGDVKPNATDVEPASAHASPARGVLLGVAGRAVYFAAGYLASIVLARRLGPTDYGIYGVVMSVLLWVEQIGKFTFSPAVAKLIPERGTRAPLLEQTASSLNLIFFAGLFAALWLAAPALARVFELGEPGVRWFRIAALDLPIFGWYAVNRGVLLGRREFFAASAVDALYSLMKFVGAVILLTIWLSVASALAVNIVASVAAWLFLVSRRSITLGRIRSDEASLLVRFALPMGFYMVMLQTLASLDLWLLKAISLETSDTSMGLYVAARNVALVPPVIFMVVSDVLLPSLSGALAARNTALARRYVQGAVRFLWLTLVPVCVLFALGADTIMVLLYTVRFEDGGLYLRLIIWSAIALPFVDLFASALSARGEPFLSGRTLLLLIPAALLIYALVIPAFGAVGAAVASAVIGSLAAFFLGLRVYRRFGPLLTLRTSISSVIALVLMVSLATRLTLAGPLLAVGYAGCLGVYALALVLLGEVKRHELESLASWMPGRLWK